MYTSLRRWLLGVGFILSGYVPEKAYTILQNGSAVQINKQYNGVVTVVGNLITVKAL